jgi:drug/metabolite transporter (DMT)-like permease
MPSHPVTRMASQARPRGQRMPSLLFLSTATLAILAPAGVALLWGASFVAAKAVLTEIPPVTLACLRFVIAALVLAPLAYWRGFRPTLNRRSALMGLSGMTFFYLFQNVGLQEASAAEATLLLGGGLPILTALLGTIVLGERLDRWQLGGLSCSLLGVCAVALLTGEGPAGVSPTGAALLLLAAGSGAVFAILGRSAFAGPDMIAVLAGSTLFGLLFLLPVAAVELHRVGMVMPSGRGVALLLYLGLGCSALAFVFIAFGLRHLTATQNAVIRNLELPVGLLAAALLGEALGQGQLAGGALILTGAVLAAAARGSIAPVA